MALDRDIRSGYAAPSPNDYAQRLYKLIPAEVTAAYLAVSTLLTETDPAAPGAPGIAPYDLYLFYSFIALFILVPFYMWIVQGVRTLPQILATTISFPVWAANVSAPLVYEYFHVPPPAIGAVLIIWTTTLPLFVR